MELMVYNPANIYYSKSFTKVMLQSNIYCSIEKLEKGVKYVQICLIFYTFFLVFLSLTSDK